MRILSEIETGQGRAPFHQFALTFAYDGLVLYWYYIGLFNQISYKELLTFHYVKRESLC